MNNDFQPATVNSIAGGPAGRSVVSILIVDLVSWSSRLARMAAHSALHALLRASVGP